MIDRSPASSFRLSLIGDLADIGRADWNRCAGGHPFTNYDFLHALQESGSTGADAGWQPLHAVLKNETDAALAVTPLYVKSHSQGEYVFDHGWADAFMRAGGQYYPKLQIAVPFTPVSSERLLADPNYPNAKYALAQELKDLPQKLGVSSLHVTFCAESEASFLAEAGFLIRHGLQYHWHNHDYKDFDDFLARLASRKRKMLRRERRDVQEAGITHRWLTGTAIEPEHWRIMFRFYQDTGDRKWGRPYLTEAFFSLLGRYMSDRVLLIFAEKDGKIIAGALNIIGGDALYGRYWGCDEAYKFLHFETCYYQAIDYAITHGLRRVEAGAQGEHKLLRGYLPCLTYSAHAITHPGLRQAVDDFLTAERQAINDERSALLDFTPYKKSDQD